MKKCTIGKSVFAEALLNDEIEYIFCPDCGNKSPVVLDGSFLCEACNKYWVVISADYSSIEVEVEEIE